MRGWFFALLIVGGLCAVLFNLAELRNFLALVPRAQPAWLALAVLLQISTYVSVAGSWSVVLRAAGTPLPLRMLVPLSIAKLFADQAVPSAGMSGNVLLVDRLIASGVPRGHAASALMLSIVGYYAAYAVLALAVLVLLWLQHEATNLLAGTVSLFLLVAMAIPGASLFLLRRGGRLPAALTRLGLIRRLAEILHDVPMRLVRSPVLVAKASLLNGLVFLADAATLLMALLALGQSATFDTALIAFIMASIAVTLAPVPMGLGSFEAVSIAMLRLFGVPLEPAITATLLLRGLTLWLPLVPGMLLMRRGPDLRRKTR